MTRNPPWKREELILTLQLYLNSRDEGLMTGRASDIADLVVELNLLNDLIHDKPCERVTKSVSSKISNLVHLDSNNPSNGFENGGKLDKVIWEEFSQNREALDREAALIRELIHVQFSEKKVPFLYDESFAEGSVKSKIHLVRERNTKLVYEVKKVALERGELSCEVCGVDFYQVYGELGKGYIECHHKIPLSTYKPNQKTKKEDLALVCANCHRMLHRDMETISIEKLKEIVSKNLVDKGN